MSSSRTRSLAALIALGGLFPGAGVASAAASRIVRPVTDAPAPAATSPAPTAVQGARTLPLNPMRETAPGVYEGIVPLLMPDGTWLVHLDERFHAFSVLRLGEGSRRSGTCVHGAVGLARWQAPAAVPATKWEVR